MTQDLESWSSGRASKKRMVVQSIINDWLKNLRPGESIGILSYDEQKNIIITRNQEQIEKK